MKEKVIIGLSGGVDSSVAAWVLKEAGYQVEGLYMRNWHDTTGVLEGDCSHEDDVFFARQVAEKLEIPFHMTDLSEEYRKRVVDYMFEEYEQGRTPNPDVLCNREIKFDSFAAEAFRLGASKVATGHYCRSDSAEGPEGTKYRLLAGADRGKDQSYFLCQLTQKQLSTALFPIGHMQKPEVRKLAADLQLANADRKDSQGICFIGKVDLPTFLQQQLKPKTGRVIEIFPEDILASDTNGLPDATIANEALEDICRPHHFHPSLGKTIGKHRGAHFYTIGQRKGLNIGGYKEPLFIIGTDTNNNIVYTGEGQSHPGLYRKGLRILKEDIHWIRDDLKAGDMEYRDYRLRIRYRQELQDARIFFRTDACYIVFDKLQRGVAPGQFAAWYDGDELIGSGVISS